MCSRVRRTPFEERSKFFGQGTGAAARTVSTASDRNSGAGAGPDSSSMLSMVSWLSNQNIGHTPRTTCTNCGRFCNFCFPECSRANVSTVQHSPTQRYSVGPALSEKMYHSLQICLHAWTGGRHAGVANARAFGLHDGSQNQNRGGYVRTMKGSQLQISLSDPPHATCAAMPPSAPCQGGEISQAKARVHFESAAYRHAGMARNISCY